ncbi:oocyte zinc finger protein XlCOF8.4-like [Rhinoderma darwinii]|uniref:oocyte zinc finger protein XlCOF8.4-like n=1 Tax=Rhinoderma darwinii TaxID=43563 RepID=UPI003F662F87
MDKDRNEMSRRILDFTLEIIYLLSGEEYTIVKKTSGDCTTPIIHESGGWSSSQSPITEPPPHSRIHEKKILDLIYKITELLTGEVPIRCQDLAVYFSMEEWEYLEGHKDLYEEVMMEDYRPRTSQGEKRQIYTGITVGTGWTGAMLKSSYRHVKDIDVCTVKCNSAPFTRQIMSFGTNEAKSSTLYERSKARCTVLSFMCVMRMRLFPLDSSPLDSSPLGSSPLDSSQ